MPELLLALRERHHATPVMAVEVEFYLHEATALEALDAAMRAAGIAAHPAEAERGHLQYEIALHPTADLMALAETVTRLPEALRAAGMLPNLHPKPFASDYGNGLHWHIHLENDTGEYLYTRADAQTPSYSPALLHSIGGLLATLPEMLPIFAPNPESALRFTQPKMNAPTVIAWGANNRSTAIRLPNKSLDRKHIEHRVAGTDANPHDCTRAILYGVLYGLDHACDPGAPIHGEASDAQYGLPPILPLLPMHRVGQ